MKKDKLLRSALLPCMILLAWLGSSWWIAEKSYIFPSPEEVWLAFYGLLTSGALEKHLAVSFYRVFVGFFLAFVIAFFLALWFSLVPRLREYVEPVLEIIRHIPPLAALPMLILWCGIGELPKLLIVILATFFPIFLNTLAGLNGCDPKLLEVGQAFEFTRYQLFRRIMLPAALPAILVGMRLGLGYSWRALIGAELIAASSGIGYLILDAEQLARPDVVLAGILTIGIIGSAIDGIFFYLTQCLIPWEKEVEIRHGRS